MSSSKKQRNNQQDSGSFERVVPKNKAQTKYLNSIIHNRVTFGIGPAGTGKTFVATSYAAELLYYKKINKIILTRPAVTAEEDLGFLPGDLMDKYTPYLAPFKEIFEEKLGSSFYKYNIGQGIIEPIPIGFMRGRTFKNCFVIIDEGQNCTQKQMKLLLSRMGENSTVVVEGDISQKDISGISGLEDASTRLSKIPLIETIKFNRQDIIRSGICRDIMSAYDN